MAGAALTAGAAGLGLTYLRRNQGDAAIDRWDEACFLESEEKEALQAYVNDGQGSKHEFSKQKPSPNLLRSAVAFWREKVQWDKEKYDAEVQRQKLELQKDNVELQRQKLELQKDDVELQRQKLELQKDKDKHDVELQRQKLQLQLEEDKRDAELEKKRKAQELEKDLQTTQLVEKAISIKRKSQLSESEANVLLNAAWHPELPLHRILKLGPDLTDWKGQIKIEESRKRIEFRGTTTTFGRKYRSPWQQQKIEGWPALKTKIIEKHNSAIFDNITVVWVNSSKEYSLKFLTDDKVTPGKDLYACNEDDKVSRMKHYTSVGLFLGSLIQSIFQALAIEVPPLRVLVENPIDTVDGKKIPDVTGLVTLKLYAEGKSLRRKSDDIEEQERMTKEQEEKQGKSDIEEQKGMTKKQQEKQTTRTYMVTDGNVKGRDEPIHVFARVHVKHQDNEPVQIGFVFDGVHMLVLQTDFTRSDEKMFSCSDFRTVLKTLKDGIGEVDMDSGSVDVVLQALFLALTTAGLISGGGEEKEEVEVEVDDEDRVTRNVFRIRWAGKDAFLKVGTSTQVAQEIHIRHFLCPMDTIKGKIVKCRGTSRPALLLEDAGSPVAIVDMLPTDVYQMSKEIYNLLLHVQGEHGINHNDIAMRNICKKNGVYTLIDWGVASGCGLPPPTCIPDWDTGATCFLEGEMPGPESDLESLFYVCLQLLGFKLPWESINDEEDEAITLRRYLQVPSDLFEYIYEPLRGRFVR